MRWSRPSEFEQVLSLGNKRVAQITQTGNAAWSVAIFLPDTVPYQRERVGWTVGERLRPDVEEVVKEWLVEANLQSRSIEFTSPPK